VVDREWGGGEWGGDIPLTTGEGYGKGLCPLPINFSYFWLKIPYFNAF